MEPIKRFIESATSGNLWTYVLSLGKESEVKDEDVTRLIFEKFGFLPNDLMIRTVLYRLKRDGFVSKERFKGQRAYKITEKGAKELAKMKEFSANLIHKL